MGLMDLQCLKSIIECIESIHQVLLYAISFIAIDSGPNDSLERIWLQVENFLITSRVPVLNGRDLQTNQHTRFKFEKVNRFHRHTA
ncbi:hypothetical protein CEXT_15811 [Caerostris extrusa]|uniref:Uncharacterized protein n=1 Tax=Caerostris extrusa TaxID=172846 RepID=A0AAV4RF34_CAEEX|nr:hypothetical protein CEXT_15811 [Caerostris extrusa]